jgi:cytochrome c oxidase subunit 3
VWLILGTIVLGAVFLGVKGYEYYHKYTEDLIPFAGFPFRYAGDSLEMGTRAYLNLYFLMTGLHAFHMIIGIVMLGIIAFRVSNGRYLAESSTTVNNAGLYWHFVDLVWVYLFPFFYLVAVRGGITLGH